MPGKKTGEQQAHYIEEGDKPKKCTNILYIQKDEGGKKIKAFFYGKAPGLSDTTQKIFRGETLK